MASKTATKTPEQPTQDLDAAQAVIAEAEYVVHSSATAEASASAAAVAAPMSGVADVDDLDDERAAGKANKPYYSGFCGAGPSCNDEKHRNKAGEVVRHCPYELRNGINAPRPILYCACACHRDPARAGQAAASA